MRPGPTSGPLGTPSTRGADAAIARKGFAGRPLAWLLVAAALLASAACDYRQSGNGIYAEKTIHVADFTGLRTEDGIDAVIGISSTATQTVTLTGDQNVVDDLIRTSVEAETIGSATISVLHVWSSRSFTPVIPARIVITRPSLVLAAGSDGVDLQLAGTPGWTAPGPLHVDLDGASLLAGGYAVDGAAVSLAHGSSAVLRSNGPVTGSVSADSRLDNANGTGSCAGVVTSGTGNVTCH